MNNPLPQSDSSEFFIDVLDLLKKVLDFVYGVVGYATHFAFKQ